MEEKSRTEYSFLNASAAVANNLIGNILGFLGRILLTRTLSATYVGVNGLFLELLNLLSFSELGIGTAMAFSLYKPLAEHNVLRLRSLLSYYRKLYNIVGLLVFCAGLGLTAFLPSLVKGGEEIPHLRLIFFIYLCSNVLSYPLLYKRTLLAADQREYLLAAYLIGAQFVHYIAQMIVLLTNRNFFLYVLAGCVPALLANILSARRVNKLYPDLFTGEAPELPAPVKNEVRQHLAATTMQKVGTVLVNNTDNLLLSSMIGVASVAQYSNYVLFCRGIQQVLTACFNGIINSVGNLGAVRENDEQVKHVFETAFFINAWLYGFASICLYELLTPLVSLCFGEQYIFPKAVVLIICVNVFMTGMRTTPQTFHDSLGLYRYDRYRTMIEAGINLILSIILARRTGVMGVFVGTLISGLLTSFWIEPCVLYLKGFHTSVSSFFLRFAVYAFICASGWLITELCCELIRGNVVIQLLGRVPVCIVVPNLVFFICYRRTKAFHDAVGICKHIIQILKNRRRKSK